MIYQWEPLKEADYYEICEELLAKMRRGPRPQMQGKKGTKENESDEQYALRVALFWRDTPKFLWFVSKQLPYSLRAEIMDEYFVIKKALEQPRVTFEETVQ